MIDTGSLGSIRGGLLRPLAVASARRLPALPNVPTFKEAGVPEFDLAGWTVMLAPKGTPADIVALLKKETLRALDDPTVRKALSIQGVEKSDDQNVRAFLTREHEKFGHVVRSLNISMGP
jgi:tripartite-type tricarboxylate transporter receptor subunit TctC